MAVEIDFSMNPGPMLEAKMASKIKEMSLKVEGKNNVEFKIAFGAPRRRPGGNFGSILEDFWNRQRRKLIL